MLSSGPELVADQLSAHGYPQQAHLRQCRASRAASRPSRSPLDVTVSAAHYTHCTRPLPSSGIWFGPTAIRSPRAGRLSP
jgi:hypothetical protein